MARYTVAIALPSGLIRSGVEGFSGCLGEALLALGAEVIQASKWQLVANDPGQTGEEAIRMICSWSKPARDGEIEVAVELISREPMGTGAPRTQAAIDRLLKGLAGQFGDLRVVGDSRRARPSQAGMGAAAI
jgi:hypothetical protein